MSEEQQAKNYNFKFQIRKPNPAADNEFYRAALDEATARDFTKLNEKIQELVPKTQKRIYILTWAYTDGDEIIIGNNESLEIALNEMQGPVYK